MRLTIAIVFTFISINALADEGKLKESQYKYVKASIGKGKAYFLEIGSDSCYSCKVMGETLYEIKEEHPEYNIHYINVKKQRSAALDLKVIMIPTQIIYDKTGEEVYRHIGILNNDELHKLLASYKF